MENNGIYLVTGASRGVGRATALSMANDHGRTVLAISRNAASLAALREQVGPGAGSLVPVVADLTRALDLDAIKREVAGRRIAGLVNNAGLLIKRPFLEWTAQELAQLYAVNVIAPVTLVRTLVPELQGDPPAHVVNIGSMGGFQGSTKFHGLAGYSASKAALANWSESLAVELASQGIRCNCLALGAVDTEMLREAFPGYSAPMSADDMGRFVARFAMEGHQFFNGKVLPVAISTP